MAQRDLDAALQLLADRAQYITGASGAAIALRRGGHKDMLCRASSGSNAPELGALLSTEFGLSGESVRTRQLLRCDDAERDLRVNRDVCRKLGIASVVVMPVVHDDEVLGVFELFSGQAHAFGDRDVSAVQRLTEMVETAVRLAQVTESLPEDLKIPDSVPAETSKAVAGPAATPDAGEHIPDEEIFAESAAATVKQAEIAASETKDEKPKEVAVQAAAESAAKTVSAKSPPQTTVVAGVFERDIVPSAQKPAVSEPAGKIPGKEVAGTSAAVPEKAVSEKQEADPKATLLWSAPEAEDEVRAADAKDQSAVPPVMRGLKACATCGFPISGGRVLCVECEEKKWRGQLRKGQTAPPASASATAMAPAPRKVEQPTAAAAAQARVGKTGSAAPVDGATPPAENSIAGVAKDKKDEVSVVPVEAAPVPQQEKAGGSSGAENQAPTLVLSAAMEPQSSWFSAGKYVIGFIVLVAAIVTAVLFFH